MPGLAVSRSFGDETVEILGVTAVPEVDVVDVSPEDQFIVVASDGTRP